MWNPLRRTATKKSARTNKLLTVEHLEDRVVLDNTYHNLGAGDFTQNWSNAGLITANDDWSGVPSIIGYRGDSITGSTGVDPQTLLGEGTITVDVIANQTNPNTLMDGGVAEFDGIANPAVALNGSGTADAPYIQLHLNTTGRTSIFFLYNVRDLDGSADNAVQQVALQYRIGTTGNFINIPAGFVADATLGGSATMVTAVNAQLPAAAENQSMVQVRIITANAAGNDEWVGIDDIVVTSQAAPNAAPTVTLPGGPLTVLEGAAATVIDAGATVADADSANFDTGTLTVDYSLGGTDDDRLTILTAGQISVSGANVSFNGTLIGTFAGGTGTTPLVVTFNADATPAAAQALLRNVAYNNVSDTPTAARTVRVVVTDGDGGTSGAATKVINVTAVNDAPTVTSPGAQTIAEDGTTGPLSITVADADNAVAGLTLSGSSNNPTLVPNANIVFGGSGANRTVTVTPAANQFGTATITVTVPDGTATGTATFDLTVTAVNDAPLVATTPTNPTFTENGTGVAVFSGTTIDPVESGDNIDRITLTVVGATESASEVLNIDGTDVNLNNGFGTTTATNGLTVAVTTSGSGVLVTLSKTGGISPTAAAAVINGIRYLHTTDNPTAGNRVVTLTSVRDTGGGSDTATLTAASTVTVVPVNDAPVLTGANNLTAINEDPATNPGTLVSVLIADQAGDIDSAPIGIAITATASANGTWQYALDGTTFVNVGTVSATSARLLLADATTRVRFVPNANFNGTVSGLTFRAWDQSTGTVGGLADTTTNGGSSAFSTGVFTANLTVNSVNDAPSGADKTVTISQNATYTLTAADFGFTDVSDTPANTLLAVRIATTPAVGTLALSGTPVAIGQFVSVTAINAGNLTFTPVTNAFGTPYASFTFQVQDNGTTANGGIDLDPTANTITFNVNAVNQAPSGADKTVTINEDATYTFAAADFGFSDADGHALLAVRVASLPAPGTLTLGGTPVAVNQFIPVASLGSLVYTPALNGNGTNYASFTFQVQDNGGTVNGGVDLDPTPNTITFNVTAVNDAPTLNALANVSGTIGVGQTVNLSGITAGGGETQGLTVTATSSNAAVVANPVSVSYTSPGATGSLSFTPAAAGMTTVTVRVTDDNGTPGVTADDLFVERTFVVNVVNLVPVNTFPAAVATNEDTPFAFTGANTIRTDDPDDTVGSVTTVVSIPVGSGTLSSGAASGTALSFTGTEAEVNAALAALVYTPPADDNITTLDGTVTLRIATTDGAGAPNADEDFLSITVNAVNDAPSFTAGADPAAIDEDAGPQTVPGFATGLSRGPADEAAQTLTFVVTDNTNPGLFSAAPEISPTGALTFTAAPNASGTATITYRLTDSGGTSFNGANSSDERMLTITVNAVSDAPSGTSATLTVPEDGTVVLDAARFGFSDANDNPADAFAGVVVTAVPVRGALTLNGAPVTAGQFVPAADLPNLVFAPAADANGDGYAALAFRVRDTGTAGGIDTDPTADVLTFDVPAVNDEPTLALTAADVVAAQPGSFTRPGFAVFAPGGGADEMGQTATYAVTTDNPALFAVPPAIDAAGRLTFTPAPGAAGVATVTVTVSDGGATSPARTFTVTVPGPTGPGGPGTLPVGAGVDAGPSAAAGADLIAVGSGAGVPGRVLVLDARTGAVVRDFAPFGGFTGGLRVAVADVTGDGTDDLIVGTASLVPVVAVFDGVSGGLVSAFVPFNLAPSGVQIATGDVNGDGRADIIVGLDAGSPAIVALDGVTGGVLRVFAGVPGAGGGTTMAVGDFTGDGAADVATVAGPGGNGLVVVYDGKTGGIASAFFAAPGFTGDISLGMGDIDGDGLSELVAGIQVGGVTVLGAFNRAGGLARVYSAPTGAGVPRQVAPGLSVSPAAQLAIADIDSDNFADLLVSSPGGAGQVVLSGRTGGVIRTAVNPQLGAGSDIAAG